MAQTKATKKFERSHLKDTIKKRKDFAKIKQRHQQAAKRKARRAQDASGLETTQPEKSDSTKTTPASKTFEDMNVDDFFESHLELPTITKKRKAANGSSHSRKKRAKSPSEDESEASQDPTEATVGLQDNESDHSDSEDDLETHKAQLDALAEQDPEFHKYLQENDPELLALEDVDFNDLEEAADVEVDTKTSSKKSGGSQSDVTKAMVKKWDNAMKTQHSLRAAREVVLAFRAAANTSADKEASFKYTISSPQVFHELLMIGLNGVPRVLEHHLPIKEMANGKVRVPTETKKYQTITPLLKSHLTSIVYLMGNLSDAATIQLTLASIMRCLPYALSFKRLVRELSRSAVSIWSTSSSTEATRVAAYLTLRKLMTIGDPGIKEGVLRATYQGLVQGSRNTTIHTLSGINLMKNTASELWGLDTDVGYTTSFTFIRQLAIHLRNSITNNSNDSFRAVYNWQCVHSLDFWSRVLSAHCDSAVEAQKGQQSPLRPLIYPLVQVTLGVIRLIPSSTYFPLRFHLIRSLLRISRQTSTYIPLGATLYEVLNSAEMRKPPKGSTLKQLDFDTAFRAPKSYLKTRVYQDGVGEQVQELLGEFLVLWAKSVAFPELALPIVVMLKRWLKEVGPHSRAPNQNAKISSVTALLVQKIDANCKFIEQRRSKVDFAPNNRAGVESFLKDVDWISTPIGAFVAGQRKTREEKAKILEQSRREDEQRKESDKKREAEARREMNIKSVQSDDDASSTASGDANGTGSFDDDSVAGNESDSSD